MKEATSSKGLVTPLAKIIAEIQEIAVKTSIIETTRGKPEKYGNSLESSKVIKPEPSVKAPVNMARDTESLMRTFFFIFSANFSPYLKLMLKIIKLVFFVKSLCGIIIAT